MQELKEIPMDQKHKEEFIDIFNRTREDNGYEKNGETLRSGTINR